MIAQDGVLPVPAGDVRVSVVDVRENAAAAATALTGSGHEGQIYTLTGSEALTHTEMAEKIGAVTGREVTYLDVPPEQMRAALNGFGMDPWQAEGLIEDYAHDRARRGGRDRRWGRARHRRAAARLRGFRPRLRQRIRDRLRQVRRSSRRLPVMERRARRGHRSGSGAAKVAACRDHDAVLAAEHWYAPSRKWRSLIMLTPAGSRIRLASQRAQLRR